MRTCRPDVALLVVLLTCLAGRAHAQGEPAGTRAQGMAGAFVGVADDASAVYWNPAGLAAGAYVSLVLDGNSAGAEPEGGARAGSRSSWLLALSTPALGLSYYRLHAASAAPSGLLGGGTFRLDSLVTHHVGATLVQSITDRIAVGATLKLIRGVAGSVDVAAGSAEDALDDWDVVARSASRFDADLGVMATGSAGRLGLLVRNVTEPGFDTGSGAELQLDRQIRAGGAVVLLPNWNLALDVDLTRSRPLSDAVREVAIGTEAQVTRRLAARAGLRFNTAGDDGRSPAASLGASYAVLGALLLDAQVTAGAESAFRGWGVAGRVVF